MNLPHLSAYSANDDMDKPARAQTRKQVILLRGLALVRLCTVSCTRQDKGPET
jgi:hypothetical protein